MGKQKRQLAPGASPGLRIRQERERRNWSQDQFAAALAEHGTIVSISTINRWEHDRVVPRPYYRDLLCRIFNLSYDALFGMLEKTITGPVEQEQRHEQPLWTVPYMRNRYFTGRNEVLDHLHTTLTRQKTVALMALSGLGGIGKTQTALEYSYRYGDEYNDVLWLHAESLQSLISDYIVLAEQLHLPERKEAEQIRVVRAVIRWLHLTSRRWLLILDNIENLEQVAEFLPTRGSGHTLLTTRSQTMGAVIESIELDTLGREDGALFLLRRARLLEAHASLEQASVIDLHEAKAISEMLGGLPLALEQAGAYIEENQCRLADYRQLYQTRHADLLRRAGRGGARTTNQVVATTWLLPFEQVEQLNPAAADLLRLCAFLHPDGIPEALLLAGQADLGPILQPVASDPLLWDEAIGVLRRYSLVRRNASTKMLTLHRLVQTVLKNAIIPQIHKEWAERAVRIVNRAFPDVDFASWPSCQMYLPHALLCAEVLKQENLRFPEAARLLHHAGRYLYARGSFAEARPLYLQALHIRKQVLGSGHPDTAQSLHDVAELSWRQGKYMSAELFYTQALTIWEQTVGETHPDTAHSLNSLAELYRDLGKYEQAEPLFERALAIQEQALGLTHPDVAEILDNLALLYRAQGKYRQAGLLFERELTIFEQALGETHPNTAIALNNLATLYYKQGKYGQAEPLIQRALAIYEQTVGPKHPTMAAALNNLGNIYREQGRYNQAEPLYQRALVILEQALGPEHCDTAQCLHNLALLYHVQGQYIRAEALYQRALVIREQAFGPEYPGTAQSLHHLGDLYRVQGKYHQAEPLLHRALTIREQQLGSEHPDTVSSLQVLASLHHAQGKYDQAETFFLRTHAIHVQALEGEHPDMGQNLAGLAMLYRTQGNYGQAEPLFQQALEVLENRLGLEHPTVAEVLDHYALLLRQMQQEAAAVALEARADAIYHIYAQQGIQLPRVSREEITLPLHQQEKDPLAAFLAACCELNPEAWVGANQLWQSYQQWCQNTEEQTPLHRQAFAAALQERGCHPAHIHTGRIWRGMRLRE